MEEQTKAELRKERNEGKSKGYAVIGMRKMALKDMISEYGEDCDMPVFIMAVGLDENCRTDVDIRDVMKERKIMGTIYPMRNMKPVTQREKSVTMFD